MRLYRLYINIPSPDPESTKTYQAWMADFANPDHAERYINQLMEEFPESTVTQVTIPESANEEKEYIL